MPAHECQTSEHDLVTQASAGVEAAFEALFETYYEPIRRFAYRIVLDYQAADDVAQETFIRAARKLSTMQASLAFQAWIYRIASNTAKDHLRSHRAHQKKLLAAQAENTSTSCSESSLQQRAQNALKAMQALPVKQREAVALVYLEDLSHAEAALRIGCAESTISWRIYLAKRTLRKILQPKP